jgi:hypothetical protein
MPPKATRKARDAVLHEETDPIHSSKVNTRLSRVRFCDVRLTFMPAIPEGVENCTEPRTGPV